MITTQKQTMAYIRSKRQTLKKIIIAKQKQIIKFFFSKRRNAVTESEKNTIQELQDLKYPINTKKQLENQKLFSDSKATSPSSIKEKRRKEKSYFNKPVCLYN